MTGGNANDEMYGQLGDDFVLGNLGDDPGDNRVGDADTYDVAAL